MIGAGFCAENAEVWQFIGYVVTILKIVIPSILVILGVISLGKAVISSDDKEIKTAANMFIKKFIVAVVIFFIPSIISALFNFVGANKDEDYKTCIHCISNPSGCDLSHTA